MWKSTREKVALFCLLLPSLAMAQSTITTWTLVEPAGVNHPSQPVCFPYSGGVLRYETNRVLGPASTEVVWQQLRDGSVCVVASLAADDAGDTYTLQSGAPTTVTTANRVVMDRQANYIQLTNGLVGVRVPTAAAQAAASPAYSLAPMSEVLIGGSWYGGTPKIQNGRGMNHNGGTAAAGSVSFCTAASQTIKESGPLQTTISTSLQCTRPEYSYAGIVLRSGGIGFFNSEITVYAGSRSVVQSVYTDIDVFWQIDLSSAYSTLPNLIAWRGHSSGSVNCGYYLPDGSTKTLYPAMHARGDMTALTDLSYGSTKLPSTSGGCTARTPSMTVNYAAGAGQDSAFAQWLLHDAESGTYPVVGIWAGEGSKQIGRITSSGFSTYPTGISTYHAVELRGANGSFVPIVGAEFGFWFGTQADLPTKTQHSVRPAAILNEMNGLRGPFRLSRMYVNTLAYADPAGGYKWPFLSESAMDTIVTRINTDTDYYNALIASGPGTEGTRFVQWARFQDDTRRNNILSAGTPIKTGIERWVLGDGRFDRTYKYYEGLYEFVRNIDNFHAVIKDPGASAAQVAEAKRWLGLGAWIANDNDYFQYDAGTPDGGGNENQIYQFVIYRNLLALVMSHHPSVTPAVLKRATDDLSSLLINYWNSTGSGKASTHYQSNYAEPSVGLMLAAIKKGIIPSVAPYTRLSSSINWDLSSLTPQECRFNNRRKAYSNGDGNCEASTRLGILGSAFNNNLAMWGWRSQDLSTRYTHGSFYFPTVGMIDDTISQTDPALGSLYMDGYHHSLRAGWETVNETAAWLITGGWYSDHKHRDNGQLSVYAHRAPLSIDWNADLYSPQTAGGYMHSRAVKESQLSVAWDGTMTDFASVDSEWGTAASNQFGRFQYGSLAKTTFGGTWTRDVRMLNHSASYPIIIVRDSFSGADAGVSKILSSTHMATGAVTVNGAGVTPTTRDWDAGSQRPSCTAGAALSAGLNRLQFTGQSWAQHSTGGINWDAYLNVSSAADYCLGNWSHVSHPTREIAEYSTANGSSFRERQHILRVRTSDSALETVLLPWRKGESTTFTVTNQACGTQIVRGTHTTCSNADRVTWTDGTDYSLMATGAAEVTYQSMTIAGGPAEIRTSGSDYIATVQGLTPAVRTITLPSGSWYPNGAAVRVSGNQYRLYHDGAAGPRSVTFSATPSGGVYTQQFRAPSGASSIVIEAGGVAVASEACATSCSVTVALPSGATSIRHKWTDSNGVVLFESGSRQVTI